MRLDPGYGCPVVWANQSNLSLIGPQSVFNKVKKPAKSDPVAADYCINDALPSCSALIQRGSRPIRYRIVCFFRARLFFLRLPTAMALWMMRICPSLGCSRGLTVATLEAIWASVSDAEFSSFFLRGPFPASPQSFAGHEQHSAGRLDRFGWHECTPSCSFACGIPRNPQRTGVCGVAAPSYSDWLNLPVHQAIEMPASVPDRTRSNRFKFSGSFRRRISSACRHINTTLRAALARGPRS
jgi:hypothetical protein